MATIKKTWILFLHEGRILARQPLTYCILALNLLIVNALTMSAAPFFDTSHTSLRPLFHNIPILSSFFIPALTMSHWARSRTLDALPWFFSFPLPLWSVVLVRFALAWGFALLALLSTFPLSFTLSYLGQPDWGNITSGFFILGALFSFQVAWGGLCSALAPHQLAAYVCGAGGNLFFLWLGAQRIYEGLVTPFPNSWTDRLSPLGVPDHLIAAFRGVLDLRDILYFVGWTVACLLLSQNILYNKRKQRRPGRTVIFGSTALALGCLLAILFARELHVRWDLTEEKLYTLSPGTKTLVRKLQKPVHVDFFVSQAQMPPRLKHFSQRIEELLREYAATAPGRFHLRNVDPSPDSEQEVEARVAGMQAIPTEEGGSAYLGLAMSQGEHRLSIPLFNVEKEGSLEYDITETLVKLEQASKPSLGIMSSLPMVGDQLGENVNLRNDWAFVSALRSLYEVFAVPIQAESIPDTLKTLILIHPQNLSQPTLQAIENFLIRGGKLIVFLDAFARAQLAYPGAPQSHLGLASGLESFLKEWGVTFHAESLVGDSSRAAEVELAQRRYAYPFQLKLTSADMNPENPVSKQLQQIQMLETGWFEGKDSERYSFIPLIQSSEESGLVPTAVTEYMGPDQLTDTLKPDGERRTVAALVKGQWRRTLGTPLGDLPFANLNESTAPGYVLLVGDVDMLSDRLTVDKIQSLGQMVYKPKGDNLTFLLNGLEFINGNQELIAIRSRPRVDRSMHRILDLERLAMQASQGPDASLTGRIREIQDKLAQWESGSSQGQVVSVDQQRSIQELREEEARLRRERRVLKEASLGDLNQLKSRLYFLHLVLAPSSLLLGFLWIWRQRRRQTLLRAS